MEKITSSVTPIEQVNKINEIIDNAIWSTNVTNCITEIPQDIKLVLNNGTLTLKAGSKVYNGDGTFYTNTSDISITPSWGTLSGLFVFPVISGSSIVSFDAINPSLVFSGNTSPTFSGNYAYWFDTTTKKVKYTNNGGSSWSENRALPLCSVTSSNGVVTFIDQIFNGFGYIGSTVFALPGVKGLIPNGRNADGTLINIKHTIPSVRVASNNYTFNDGLIVINPQNIFIIKETTWTYNEETNYFENTSGGKSPHFEVARCVLNSGTISNFISKKAFHAADYTDLNSKADKSSFQVVSTLPANPDSNTFYFIPE